MSLTDFLAAPIGSTECRIWPGAINSKGYGSCTNGHGGTALAHRVAYELHVGPIPAGLTVDHLCHNKLCVNPRHMEIVTRAENSRRAAAARTHCQRGHEFSPANVYWRRRLGATVARECRSCRTARWKARVDALVAPQGGEAA